MKKVFLCICAILLTNFAAFGATITGEWNLNDSLFNGFWGENFSNGPGQPGNVFVAIGGDLTSSSPTIQWQIIATLKNQAVPNGAGGYITQYEGSLDLYSGGPWGTENLTFPIIGTNISYGGDPGSNLNFTFQAGGLKDSYLVNLSAAFEGYLGTNYFQKLQGQNYISHGSYLIDDDNIVVGGFKDLNLKISPVPIPAAAWLLGTGLVGLVGLRRKIRS
jgi:hypothetical protein